MTMRWKALSESYNFHVDVESKFETEFSGKTNAAAAAWFAAPAARGGIHAAPAAYLLRPPQLPSARSVLKKTLDVYFVLGADLDVF